MSLLSTTRQKVIGLLAAGFVVLIVNVLFSTWADGRTTEYAALTVADQQLKAGLNSLLSAAQDAETGQRGYLLTHEERYLEPYHAAVRDMPFRLEELKRLSAGHANLRARLPQLQRLAERRMEIIATSIERSKSGDREAAMEVVRSGLGKDVMDELRAATASLGADQDRQIGEGLSNLATAENWSRFINLATLPLILGLAAVTANVVLRFVRELNETQQELQEVNSGLERIVDERTGEIVRANEEIQRFAYIVSHDLRAPLVNIMGFTSELEQIGKLVDQQYQAVAEAGVESAQLGAAAEVKQDLAEAVGFIRASTSKMDRLINAILGLSREGRRMLAPVTVDMTDLVNSITASMQHQISQVGGEFVVGKLPPITTDRLAIEQVFSNLIENAVKYVDASRAPRVEISGHADGRLIEYQIADNGRGIDAKDQERVFELFRRAGRQDQPGEGLGLAFVRAAVRRLGGTITLDSEAGKGSTFKLRLPAKLQPSRSKTNG